MFREDARGGPGGLIGLAMNSSAIGYNKGQTWLYIFWPQGKLSPMLHHLPGIYLIKKQISLDKLGVKMIYNMHKVIFVCNHHHDERDCRYRVKLVGLLGWLKLA